MAIEIKDATVADMPVMAKAAHVWHDIAPYAEFQRYNEQNASDTVYQLLQNPNCKFVLAWDEEKMVGLLFGHLQPNFYDSSQMFARCAFYAVIPGYQKKGVSKMLRSTFEVWAKERGAGALAYTPYSKQAIASLKREGFKRVEVTMMKRLEG